MTDARGQMFLAVVKDAAGGYRLLPTSFVVHDVLSSLLWNKSFKPIESGRVQTVIPNMIGI